MSRAIAEQLDTITNLEADLDRAEALARELDGAAHDRETVRAVLGVFERCGHMEDFGIFATLASYLERGCEDADVAALVEESVRRAPSWKTLEILPAFVPAATARALIERTRAEGLLRDERFDDEWLESLLSELDD